MWPVETCVVLQHLPPSVASSRVLPISTHKSTVALFWTHCVVFLPLEGQTFAHTAASAQIILPLLFPSKILFII